MNRKSRKLIIAGLVATFLTGACSKFEHADSSSKTDASSEASAQAVAPHGVTETSASLDARVSLPEGWEEGAIVTGECMTPVDSINGVPPSSAAYTGSSQATFIGWNIVGANTDPTPPSIFGVLKPYDQTQAGSLLTGKRVSRPDVAGKNMEYLNAGYELSGQLPVSPGRYRFYVWTGTPESIVECDSKVIISIE